MEKTAKIYVAQHWDMIGAGIAASLRRHGYKNIITKSVDELDLTSEAQVRSFFELEHPEYVFCFAGPHGGIIANVTYPADFMYANLKIQTNIIHSCYEYGVKKLLFMAGNCAYPKESPQPIIEEYFMTNKMEPTSEAYSTARAAGIVMCAAYNRQYNTHYVPAILTNYYGAGDDFSENGHVLASVLKKMVQAKHNNTDLELWGDGTPRRQFMYIDDMADAAVKIMESYNSTELINIAGGMELSIREMTEQLRRVIGFEGKIHFDASKPNGAMRKLLDYSKLRALGFQERISFEEGLRKIYDYYITEGKGTL